MRTQTFNMCDDCYHLVGEMCHEPECIFCRKTMKEVSKILDVLYIRPIMDGVQRDFEMEDRRDFGKSQK